MEKRKVQFSQNFGKVNFEKLLVDNCIVLFLQVLNRVAHVCGVCIKAIHLNAKKDYQKYKYFD